MDNDNKPILPALPLDLDTTNPRLTFPIKAGELAEMFRQYGRQVYALAREGIANVDEPDIYDAVRDYRDRHPEVYAVWQDNERRAALAQAAPDIAELKAKADLYDALRAMHWYDKKLAVVQSKNLVLGTQTYSGDMLDEEIRRWL